MKMKSKLIHPSSGTIPMGKMKPLEVGVIVSEDSNNGCVVMRTASERHFEVMDLTNSGVGCCWSSKTVKLSVRLLDKGETVKVTLFN